MAVAPDVDWNEIELVEDMRVTAQLAQPEWYLYEHQMRRRPTNHEYR